MLNVIIGFDRNESVAYHVLAHSIMRRATKPVAITPLYLPQLEAAGLYKRKRDPLQSTDFTFSRFLAPYIANDDCIFMDCDMLCLTDIHQLYEQFDPYKAVQVVKHDYVPKPDPKFLGHTQTVYPCKNWSSLMMFNSHNFSTRRLTPDYIHTVTAMDLHQFKWVHEEERIGGLDIGWNHLVGEYGPTPHAKIVHFTLGGPWFKEYEQCEYADQWWAEWHDATSAIGAGKC